ncbi:hypothetical protein [Polyangium sorediatum]|uniref:Uncharacterized protein n=1 Tax=Polyangium sorediatum TaxID=889274 RepID=A0ABT6P4V4_9BACT|nr:hypothetical protein [Polyangium sorediatum]MDI1435645.1 hypothetical protein [Polyangium sorediatum]
MGLGRIVRVVMTLPVGPFLAAVGLLLLSCTRGDAPASTTGDAPVAPPSSPPAAVVAPAPTPAPSPSADPPGVDADATETGYCDPEKPPPIPSPDLRLYAVWRTFPVDLGAHGGAGKLRVLEDARVTRPGAARAGTHPSLPPCDLLPSRVELIDEKGATVQVERFSPELDVELRTMGPGAFLIEMIERIRCLASCWCGDSHAFWRIQGGRLVPHEGRVVERRPAAGTPGVGAILKVKPVTHGCYEGSSFETQAGRPPALVVNRRAMGTFVTAAERHWFEDGEWKASIVEWK